MKRFVVTGGLGFIGSAMVEALLADGCKVLNVDKYTYAADTKTKNLFAKHQMYDHLLCDICDTHQMTEALFNFKPDGIFNFAAETHVDNSISDPAPFISSNIHGVFSLLNASKKYIEHSNSTLKSDFKFIQISTDEVFGSLNDNGYFDENSAYRPSSPYSASKAASDHLCRAWNVTYNFPTIVTNCSNNFGPRQNEEKLIPAIVKSALEKRTISIYGDGLNVRDWLYVQDHIDALRLIFDNGKIGETYCIGTNNEISNISLAEKICDIIGLILNDNFNYRSLIKFVDDRPGHDYRYAINADKLKNELHWKPKTKFEENLKETINWFIERYKFE